MDFPREFDCALQSMPAELASLDKASNNQLIDHLTLLVSQPKHTASMICHFQSIVPEICSRFNRRHAQDPIQLVTFYGSILFTAPYMSETAATVLTACSDGDLLTCISDSSEDRSSFLLGVLRLMRLDNATFGKLIRPVQLQLLLHDPVRAVRYLAARIFCLYMHASDATFQDIVQKYCGDEELPGSFDGDEIDYAFLDLWEQKRQKETRSQMLAVQDRLSVMPRDERHARELRDGDLSEDVVAVAGVVMPRRRSGTKSDSDSSLVMTDITTENLRSLSKALMNSSPVLVSGPAGAGKTIAINHIAARLDKAASMITLHLNEQSDAKSLLGIYTAGDKPGSFQWQAGVLTTAVREGRWVFVEDLDSCPNEVLSLLAPLLERRQLRIPGHDSSIVAHAGFKIIATMRTHQDGQRRSRTRAANMLASHTWLNVLFQPLGRDQLSQIITERFPLLSKLRSGVIAVFERLQQERATARGKDRDRATSSRDLLKWCTRISNALLRANYQPGISIVADFLHDGIFLDAVDCFLGWKAEDDHTRSTLIAAVASELQIDPQRRDHLCQQRKPSVARAAVKSRVVVTAGRATVGLNSKATRKPPGQQQNPYALNKHSSCLMEQIGVAIQEREPVLLVGETGIGKTSAVQHLAQMLGQSLLAINLSQQSEVSDLIGGFKPVTIRSFVIPLKDEFDVLFEQTFSQKKNAEFMKLLGKAIAKSQWKRAVMMWREALKMVDAKLALWSPPSNDSPEHDQPTKRRKLDDGDRSYEREQWLSFAQRLEDIERRLGGSSDSFAFSFVEGKLVKAVREGSWVLLDEINLASPDTLECLSDLLEAGPTARPSIMLTETGSPQRIEAHPNFRLVAAMNPSTDIGKRDLPLGIRSRFTELYVESPDRNQSDLENLIQTYVCRSTPTVPERKICSRIATLYTEILKLVREGRLLDGSGQKPQYSLRTLTRSLQHAMTIGPDAGLKRALYEGFSMCFSTCLGTESFDILDQLVQMNIFQDMKTANAELRKTINPAKERQDNRVSFKIKIQSTSVGSKAREELHWLSRGAEHVQDPEHYIITPYIGRNLRNLIRAASTRKYPVLIQGPTSAGKTSMVEYLAKRSGNRFVRINNHEHTDLQEYLGTYVSTPDGRLVFQEGVLVEALRKGYWVVLDELNLAPTDILEALNRLLDDNRELFIPETQELVKPHPDFMLFATQNPVGAYGGRKILSRAFRNRFLELHFDDIPVTELNVILAARTNLPESWCALIIEVYKKLSQRRQEARLFEQNSFATLRDLFRWAFRGGDTIDQLAVNGFMLLGDKVRKVEERDFVRSTIEEIMSRKGVKVKLDDVSIYSNLSQQFANVDANALKAIVPTKAMRRLSSLVSAAVKHNEPVLLVGETGGGKTTICQLIAEAAGKKLYAVNAHQNMETGDIVGAQRPVRNKAAIEVELVSLLQRVLSRVSEQEVSDDLVGLLRVYKSLSQSALEMIGPEERAAISQMQNKSKALFEWHDGTLVQSMREGNFFLLDEISLADDSVLERMNSVLDPQRSILLAEKGAQDDSSVTAADGFQLFATMNPGGDFGKKELSPALRNRFTEIWVPPMDDTEDVLKIVQEKISSGAQSSSVAIVEFASWFNKRYHSSKNSSVSIRDILAWVNFVNLRGRISSVSSADAIIHGAMMVYIDTIGANPSGVVSLSGLDIAQERQTCLSRLCEAFDTDPVAYLTPVCPIQQNEDVFTIGSFGVEVSGSPKSDSTFHFGTTTTRLNAMRILRGLQVDKPILIEGAPGVGKTSLVTAIASSSGHHLTRINLSDQTDLMDLFGSDIPVEDAEPGTFAWRDAPFLTAMNSGGWVLLDEMNLAAQPILEGLNACIDHRGEVFVPELDRTFQKHPDFRLFAAQNPQHQGGGRKGLPLSFVNRFTVVYADILQPEDLQVICHNSFPRVDDQLIHNLINFLSFLEDLIHTRRGFGARGSPWEFNLRDALRFLALMDDDGGLLAGAQIHDIADVLFTQRFRTAEDRQVVQELIFVELGEREFPQSRSFNLTPSTLQIGISTIPRAAEGVSLDHDSVTLIQSQLGLYESIAISVQQSWPVILVGPPTAKKAEAIGNLAALTGVKLEILAVSTDVDASDLIGAFEQVDPIRTLRSLLDGILDLMKKVLSLLVRYDDADAFGFLEDAFNDVFRITDKQAPSANSLNIACQALTDILTAVEDSGALLEFAMFQWIKAEANHRFEQGKKLLNTSLQTVAARFQWIDSVLVRAVEEGHWLVLENANLCSASVLDRLNSLLELGGALIINEHCDEDGTAKVIQPHPDFRIFLTYDPQFGEISRAMRNRALEVFVPPVEDETEDFEVSLDSSLLRYSQLTRATNSLPATVEPNSLHALYAFQHLAPADFEKVSRFARQAAHGLLDQRSSSALNEALTSYEVASKLELGALQNPGMLIGAVEASKNLRPDFRNAQPVQVLVNQPTALVVGNQLFSQVIGPAAILQDLEQEAGALRMSLSTLHQSSVIGRSSHSKQERKYLGQVEEVLNVLGGIVVSLLKAYESNPGNTLEHFWIRGTYLPAKELLRSWRIFTQLVSGTFGFDAFVLEAYILAIRTRMKRIDTDVDVDRSACDAFAKSLSVFDPPTTSVRGISFERIWTRFRPQISPSRKQLIQFVELEQVAAQLDELSHSFRAPLSDLASIRQRVIEVAHSMRSGENEEVALVVLQQLRQTLEESSLSGQGDLHVLKPHFQDVFATLNRLDNLRSKPASDASEVQMLSLLGQIPLAYPLRTITSTAFSKSWGALYQYLGPRVPGRDLVLGDDTQKLVWAQLTTLQDVRLDSVELLRSELDILGRRLATDGTLHDDSDIKDFLDLLERPLCELLAAHQDLVQGKSSIDVDSESRAVLGAEKVASNLLMMLSGKDNDQGIHEVRLLADILKKDVIPSLRETTLGWSHGNQSSKLGKSIVQLAIACLRLYVPERIFDPAQRLEVERTVFDMIAEDLAQRRATLSQVSSVVTGQSSNLRTMCIDREIALLGTPPDGVVLERPPVSQLSDIQVHLEGVFRVMDRAMTDGLSSQRLEDVSGDISRLVDRLSKSYRAYDDLLVPIIGFLLMLQMGCLIQIRNRVEVDPETTPEQPMPLINADVSVWHSGSWDSQLAAEPSNSSDIENLFRPFVFRAAVQEPKQWSATAAKNVHSSFNLCFRVWKERLVKDRKDAAAASNLYRYRGGQDDLDEEEREAFDALFPTYEAVEEGEDEEQVEHAASHKSAVQTQVFPSVTAKNHVSIFLQKSDMNATDSLLHSIQEVGLRFGRRDAKTLTSINSAATRPDLFGPLMLAMHHKREVLNPEHASHKPVNIYTDGVLPESLRLRDLTTQTYNRASEILKTWPEHTTLHNIRALCSEVFGFKHAEPLVKYLTKTEQLHAYVAEWQTVASRDFTMVKEYDALTSLIVGWRRLELSTWARLLDIEVEKAHEGGRSWFFVAYENLVAIPWSIEIPEDEVDDHVVDTIKTLENLLKNSSIGQFQSKLEIIESLCNNLAINTSPPGVVKKLQIALINFVAFFKRHTATVQDAIDASRKELEKKVKDVVQLASWRDVNITSLRQSAKASHRKLFNVVRKFREVLGKPVLTLLGDLAPKGEMGSLVDTWQPPTLRYDISALEVSQSYSETWQTRPVRFQNVKATSEVMGKMLPFDDGDESIYSLADFVNSTETAATQLKNATPGILTEENTASVKHLLTRKRRLYADTLKSLKHMGLRYTQTPAVLSKQKSLAVVLSGCSLFHPALNNEAKLVDQYFFASLDAMDAARAKSNDHSDELTQNDVNRSIGLCEGILAMSLAQRQQLIASKSALDSFESHVKTCTYLWHHDRRTMPTNDSDSAAIKDYDSDTESFTDVDLTRAKTRRELDLSGCISVLTWLPTIIAAGRRMIQVQAELAKLDLADAIIALDGHQKRFEKLRQDFSVRDQAPPGLLSRANRLLVKSARSSIEDYDEEINRLIAKFPQSESILSQLRRWTDPALSTTERSQDSREELSISQFNSSLYATLDQILAAAQDVEKANDGLPGDADTDDWLVKAHSARSGALAAFRINKITSSFSKTAEMLAQVKDLDGFKLARASMALAIPIVHRYQGLYHKAQLALLDLHGAVARMHYKISTMFCIIASQGFCKPPEKSDEKQSGNDKIESGTGLGEGEGAEDISKDIAEDEDLSELAQDAQNSGEKGDEGKENEDNAVDIEDEMQGGASGEGREEEEVDEDKKAEKGDEEEQDDKEMGDGAGDDEEGGQEDGDEDAGMDEGVGEVDEAEPSAVDEKFWDQAGDENQREKEGKQQASRKDKDEQAAGKDGDRRDDDDAEGGQDDDDISDGSGEEDNDASTVGDDDAAQQQKDVMDPQVHQSEELDLPDDLNLDGDKKADGDEDDEDLDMDALSDEGAPEENRKPGDDDDSAEPEEAGEDEKATGAQEDSMDVDEDQPEPQDTEDQGQDESSKPYASEQQTNQDVDPNGTAQGTEGTEMISGAAQDVDQEMAPPNDEDEKTEQESQDKTAAQEQAQPAGQGEPGQSTSTKPSRDTQPQTAQQESIKKLGDILEQWHRQQQKINEASQRDEGQQEQQDVDVGDADFEHLPDDDAKADTQALGAANQEQARALDESMALPDERKDETAPHQDDQFLPEAEDDTQDKDGEDVDMEDAEHAGINPDDKTRAKSMMGENATTDADDRERLPEDASSDYADDAESLDSVNDDLDSLALAQPQINDAAVSWSQHERAAAPLALILTEQLRLILTPTQATKLRGDFRTGKRLNLKRIIPYIASSYRRDKIWLRRSAPSKRNYQIQLAIDNSRSMRENGAGELAVACLAVVSRALTALEAGELGVVGFGADTFVAHPLGEPFAADAGPRTVARFAFDDAGTDVRGMVERSLAVFRAARRRAHASAADTWQLQIVLSDGVCEDHLGIRRLLLDAMDERVMFVFVVVDAAGNSQSDKQAGSILDLERVDFVPGPPGADGREGEPRLVRRRYLDSFPFRHFLVVRDVRDLPDVLAGALRSWFAEVAEM